MANKGEVFLVASSLGEALNYKKRFPALLGMSHVVVPEENFSTYEGRRVSGLYLTESVDAYQGVVYLLYQSYIMTGESTTGGWPTVLRESWREV